MKTALEKKRLVFKYLELLGDGYESGDFSKLYPNLAKDCVFESQWVLTPNTGYDAIVEYLNGKGATLRQTEAFPSCSIQELIGNINIIKNVEMYVNGEESQQGEVGLFYDAGELCLLMEQKKEDETIGVIVRIQLNDSEKIKRIDLCDPALFQYRDFYTFVIFLPSTGEKEIEDGEIRISEPYYPEMYLFLGMASFDFDEYGDLTIPMSIWLNCVEKWKKFYSNKTFDGAFEKTCGVDYSNMSVKDNYARRMLSRNGLDMWQNRMNNGNIIDEIIEWTEKYKDKCTTINSYGF